MFKQSDTHTFKVVATWRSGKKAVFNYITGIDASPESYILHGQEQTDGTMEQRSFVLERDVVAFLDVRRISTVRSMPRQAPAAAPSEEYAGGDDELAF